MNEAELKKANEEAMENTAVAATEPVADGIVSGGAETAGSTVEADAAPAAEAAGEAVAEAAEEGGAEAPADEAAEKNVVRKNYTSKQEIIDDLKSWVQNNVLPDRADTDYLKQCYYRLHNAEVQARREAFLADGGAEDDFLPAPDATEAEFKAQMGLIKERRSQHTAALEKERQENLERKLAIIEKVKAAAATPENADKAYDEVKQLQAEWKEIKNVPAEKAQELWKSYQLYIEQFYDQLRLNHEFRAYDFKKNLETKLHLCEAAEKLAEVPDPVSAFHQLQKLHQEFRETGPVAKELREEVWARFKAASTVVNKRHQAHFEKLKADEAENLVRKTALCERMEAVDTEGLKSAADWEKATNDVLQLQTEWKTIGFTPRKMNTQIFERFRTACDAFFHKKSEYFKHMRETFSANHAAKVALCEQAEALKDSTDWNATTNKFLQLQREWKATGPVARKASENLWKRFSAACNYFFEQRNAATAGQREEEEKNLALKQEIIDKLAALLEQHAGEERADAELTQTVRGLINEWNRTGHVPFRKKDKIYKKYHELTDRFFRGLHVSAGHRRTADGPRRTGATDKGTPDGGNERLRLYRAYEAKKQEIQTYENNLSFFNAKSKSGNSLVEEAEKRVARLKDELAQMAEKIKALNETAEPEQAAPEAES